MADNKKSVLLYCDIIHTIEGLKDAEAGRIFKHYLRYINDLNPTAPDRLTEIVFEPIKQNLKRDLKKWESKSKRNKEIAIKGWEKRKDANAYERTKGDAKNADTVTVTDKVKEINTLRFDFLDATWKIPFMQWVDYRKGTKKPFAQQESLEHSLKELKELSGNNLLQAQKIVQYCISNQYVTLCKPDKKQPLTTSSMQGTL